MRFGANLLRGARPLPLDHAAPGGASGGGAASLSAALSRHQKPLLVGGAGVVVALGLMHRRNAGTAPAGDGMGADPAAAANGATVAGYSPADTSGTDVYNALQPQIEQTQNMLQQLLAAVAAAGTRVAAVARPSAPKKPKKKAHHPKPKKKAAHHPKKRAQHHPKKRAHHPARRAAAPAPHKAQRDSGHVVRRGETLGSIASRHGTNGVAVHRANSRLSPAQLVPGRRIVVPNPQVRR